MKLVPRLSEVCPRTEAKMVDNGERAEAVADLAATDSSPRHGFRGGWFLRHPEKGGVQFRRLRRPAEALPAHLGKIPSPVQTHFEKSILTLDNLLYEPWVNMRHVIEAFPNPIGRVPRGKKIQ